MKPDSALQSQNKVMGWGSDVVAEMLRRLGIKYVCVNPGSSFRGLHDSLVNYLGNDDPKLMLALHEQSVVVIPDGARYAPPLPGAPSEAAVSQAAAWLHAAKNPAIMLGRVSTKSADWEARIRMAELLNARVITDMRSGASFPTAHPLHGGPHDLFLSPNDKDILAKSDVVLSLDWPDLQDCMIQARGPAVSGVKVIPGSAAGPRQNSYNSAHQR